MGNKSGEYLKTADRTVLADLSIEDIFLKCQFKGFACAIYSLPYSNIDKLENKDAKNLRNVIIDLSGGKKLSHLQLDEMGSGFIFHPYSSEDHPVKFINRDIHIIENTETSNISLKYSTIGNEELLELFNENPIDNDDDLSAAHIDPIKLKSSEIEKDKFISLVENSIGEIQDNSFQKVVISRDKKIDLPERFNPFEFFEALSLQYKNAFVYLSFIPNAGTWIGATPEILINIDRDRQFKTIALAATQAAKDDVALEDTTWSQKDIEEQAMVSRYIINCFKKIRLREFEEIGPRTHSSGNLVHLKTDYKVEMDQVAFPQLGSVMLQLLHPTSAVCGMPKEPVQSFLKENESFDREYFSGFLGPVNILEEINIFVNLRCMKVSETHAKLFAGAGIISNSNPEKEWIETEIKMDTLLKVLKELY